MSSRQCLVLACVALAAYIASADSSLLTPAQAKFIADAQAPAAQAALHAESQLLKEFNSVSFRLGLAAQGPSARSLLSKSASELLSDLKAFLNSLEFVFTFGLDAQSAKAHPGQPGWSLAAIDEFGHIPTLWELKVDGKAASVPDAQWKLVDAEETGIYRQPEFAKPANPTMAEAAQRPSYVSGNLARFDAGIWEFGVHSPVYRRSALKERAVFAGLDGGGWTTICNASASSMNKGFQILKHFVDCGAIYSGGQKDMIFGTVDHLLHSFYANTKTFGIFGETLARRIYQFLVPGATIHPLEDNMYLEAVFFGPARMQDLKLWVVSFPDIFGTEQADELRKFCKRHRIPLAWAFGGGKVRQNFEMDQHKAIWLPYEPFVHWSVNGDRLLDPASWEMVNFKSPSWPAGLGDWAAVESSAKQRRQEDANLNASTFASWWATLKNAGGTVRGLRGGDCTTQLDLCFGTIVDDKLDSSNGRCVCRKLTNSTGVEAAAVLV